MKSNHCIVHRLKSLDDVGNDGCLSVSKPLLRLRDVTTDQPPLLAYIYIYLYIYIHNIYIHNIYI